MHDSVDSAEVEEFVLRWLDSQDSQSPLSVEEVCRDRPELVEDVTKSIARIAPALKAYQTFVDESATIPEVFGDGKYTLERQIGKGFFGTVGEYLNTATGKKVAVKFFDRRNTKDAFDQEIAALQRLEHTGIASLIDADSCEQDDVTLQYLVLEFVDGQNLGDYITARNCDIRARVKMLLQVAEALSHAHKQGIVHRDIKPSNIRVTPAGEASLLD
ncbi:MAG: protein kinase, partial [Planctomycetales bacterium]|nr:protein kinase [Planctomycetales bacterium]